MMRNLTCLALLTLLSCGGGASGDDDSDAGPPGCSMVITVNPALPQVGDTVDIDGAITTFNLAGVESYTFTVTYADQPVTLDERDPFDGSRMSFTATDAGPYRVILGGDVAGTSCVDDDITVNVTNPGANVASYRFRFLPAAGQPAPAQERTFEIYGGAAFELGDIGLDNGVAVDGSVEDGIGAAVPGYLRITPQSGIGDPVEAFADGAGGFTTRVAAGDHDVLLVPDGDLAPAALDGVTASSLASLVVPDGDALSGVVQDPAGDPLPGAQVSLRIDGVPSTIATTDGGGAFTVQAHAGGVTTVSVVPPAGSGLPQLDLPASAALVAASGTPLTIRYAASLTSRSVTLGVRQQNGTSAAPGATVIWIAGPLAAAGTVTPGAGSPLAAVGSVRASAIADGGAQLTGLVLPETGYTALVLPASPGAGGQPRIATVDLSSGQATPATLSLAAAGTVTGQVTAGGAALAGAEVRATPRGVLANQPVASAAATTDAGGAFSLPLAGGGEYELAVLPRVRTSARALVDVTAPAAGGSLPLAAVDLQAALRVGGVVTIGGIANAGGVAVQVYCTDCSASAALRPIAEGVTDATGRFVLSVPDPGVSGQ
ncbi:MAG TPA: carboxypeptidase-like regulatory domain-containing protein [Kofleriaceae bacterium]|nr:carboxypeptidase-like regulatory domain-containing protein [Kofleriaceae bacterium]